MSNPIRGATRTLTPTVKADLNASIHNRFDVEVIDAKTGKIKQKAYAENVILNKRWSSYLNGRWFRYIHYGSGSGTPSASDTQLFNFVDAVAATGGTENIDTANHVYAVQQKIVLSETTAVGITITEVGIGATNASTELCTHAMLKDANGNQISIAKTSTDIVNIYATVFVHYANAASVMGDDTTDYIGLLKCAAGYNAYFKGSGSYDYFKFYTRNNSYDLANYTSSLNNGSKKITITAERVGANSCNGNGIYKVENQTDCGNIYKMFTLPLSTIASMGSNITGEAIGTGDGSTVDFATYFTDATNATIYVDGVAATGVTVDNTSAVTNNVHFATAPATGAVITGDYHTAVIAKDVNHVFDLTVTINLGEYTVS